MSDLYHLRQPGPPAPEALEPVDVMVASDDPTLSAKIDPATGALEIEQADGGVVIDFSGGSATVKDKTGAAVHGANLAEYIDETDLSTIAEDLLQAIEQDETSRNDWLNQRGEAVKLLAVSVDPPKSDAGQTDAPVQGQAVVRSPVMLEALLKFQANAAAEMLPSSGPVKVRNDATPKTDEEKLAEIALMGKPAKSEKDIQAERLEIEFNHFFTVTAREYYPDTRRLLFSTGMGGSGFKKVYRCPLRRRPVSESVDAKDIIVNNDAVDLHNAGRVTHKIMMRQSVMRRMQLAGAYRDIELGQPNPAPPDAQERAVADAQGLAIQTPQLPRDYNYTVYETYCELDVKGFEHKEDGKPTGLPLPYKVTIDKDSRKVLEVRRNWKEGDERMIGKMPIVKYPFIEALNFYGFGLYHVLGNCTNAVTAAWRMALDAGMFASFPGFLYSTSLGRQNTNMFRIPPGAGQAVDTGGQPIGNMVMPVPYKDVTPGLLSIMQDIKGDAQRVGATADMPVGEGKQNAPVGTTLALIEQATQVMGGVHKGLHAAQAEEFALIKELLAEDPDCLICSKNPRRQQEWERESLIKALNDCDLVPAADPNTPSHMHRIMKAVALMQVQGMFPGLFDPKEVAQRVLTMLSVSDVESLFAPPQPAAQPQPDPNKMAEIAGRKEIAAIQAAAKERSDAVRLVIAKLNMDEKAKDRLSKELIALMDAETERLDLAQSALIHPEGVSTLPDVLRMFPQQQFPQHPAPPQRVI